MEEHPALGIGGAYSLQSHVDQFKTFESLPEAAQEQLKLAAEGFRTLASSVDKLYLGGRRERD